MEKGQGRGMSTDSLQDVLNLQPTDLLVSGVLQCPRLFVAKYMRLKEWKERRIEELVPPPIPTPFATMAF